MYIVCLLYNKFSKVIFLRYYRVDVHVKCDNSLPALPFKDLEIYYCGIKYIDELWRQQQLLL